MITQYDKVTIKLHLTIIPEKKTMMLQKYRTSRSKKNLTLLVISEPEETNHTMVLEVVETNNLESIFYLIKVEVLFHFVWQQ